MSEYNENMQNVPQYDTEMEPVMGIGQWMIISLVMSIPCVNIIMLFVWGFSQENRTRANYCKAALIWWIISMVLMFVLSVVFKGAFAALSAGAMSS